MLAKSRLMFQAGLAFLLMNLQGAFTVQVDHVLMCGMMFCQKDVTPSGQFSVDWDKEEWSDVDLDRKEAVWRLPEFTKLFTLEAQAGLQAISVCNINLDIYQKRSKGVSGPTGERIISYYNISSYFKATIVLAYFLNPDSNAWCNAGCRFRQIRVYSRLSSFSPFFSAEPKYVMVYPEDPIELGKPNTLICNVDEFFPPVLNITWYKNDNPVYEGVELTSFYPRDDAKYRRFAYLNFIPEEKDIYSCKVEHPGLKAPSIKSWECDVPAPLPGYETTETVVCALGLAVGIIGIIIGTVLVIKGMKRSDNQRRQIR
ncbi:RLA class II histocompatibility antigen, DP alpha-1 chain-like [Protopterus annectens]|uniref:RLA class II histocompatibility antigen, DP alpha-1 chain-like n=1 Tax=Protopterus annectens TaxID=7888 RepID=UPI001CF9E115|nr:RLA class II histocompatibility antigen, DP alpha-1 chain-like [Protopterus annectens]